MSLRKCQIFPEEQIEFEAPENAVNMAAPSKQAANLKYWQLRIRQRFRLYSRLRAAAESIRESSANARKRGLCRGSGGNHH